MKKITLVMIFSLFLGVSLWAQTAEKPYQLGVNFGKYEYWGDVGNALFDFDQDFYPFFGITGRLYADNSFDYSLNAEFGNLGYTKEDVQIFKGNVQTYTFRVHYKFYNGYLLKEDCKLGPFLTLGTGLELNSGGEIWKDQEAVVFPVGAGLRYNINDSWTVMLQSVLNFSIHSHYEETQPGYKVDDKFFAHSLGIAYNFASLCPKKAGKKVVATPPVDNAPVVSQETRKIFDQALQGIQFETAKDVIKPESFPILDQVVKVMKDNPSYRLQINGHTDNQGDDQMNMDLSQRRAVAVKNYLVGKGIAENRLKPQGFGETRPVATNDTPEGRQQNRRVEFKVY